MIKEASKLSSFRDTMGSKDFGSRQGQNYSSYLNDKDNQITDSKNLSIFYIIIVFYLFIAILTNHYRRTEQRKSKQ